MNKKAISDRLRALATSDRDRSKAARLREVIDDVEAALAAGVTRAAVIGALGQHGLKMTAATFDGTLRRIRAKRGKPQAESPSPTVAIQSPGTPRHEKTATPPAPKKGLPSMEPHETDRRAESSHDPADIDKIMGSTPDLDALAKLAKSRRSKS